MAKNVPASLAAYFYENSIQIAVLVLVQRTDGVTLGFTNWDAPIVYSGVTYEPAIAMSPSGVKVNADLTTDQMDILGAIDSTYITDDDIEAGRYDMAQVTVMRICPSNVAWGVIVDIFGYVGQVDYGDGQFQVAINSLGTMLNQQLGDVVTPVCRVKQLGDSQCKVNVTTFQTATTVVSNPTGDQRTLIFNSTEPTGWYDFGMVYFASSGSGGGLNHSMKKEVKTSISNGAQTVTLQSSISITVSGATTTYTLNGGTYVLAITDSTGNTQFTGGIAYNASAATVQAALQALSNVGTGNCTVTGSAGGPWSITWTGALAGKYLLVQGDGSLLLYGGNAYGTAGCAEISSTGGTQMQIQLVEEMPFAISPGDAVTLEAGCDRKGKTCRNKYSNLVNIHAEPYTPGNSYLLRTGRPPS